MNDYYFLFLYLHIFLNLFDGGSVCQSSLLRLQHNTRFDSIPSFSHSFSFTISLFFNLSLFVSIFSFFSFSLFPSFSFPAPSLGFLHLLHKNLSGCSGDWPPLCHFAGSFSPSLLFSISLSPLASSHFLSPFAWRWIYARPIDSVGSSPTSGRLVGGSVFRCRSGRVIFGRLELRADANGRAGGRASRPLVRRRGGWWWAWVVLAGILWWGWWGFYYFLFFMSIYLLIIWWFVFFYLIYVSMYLHYIFSFVCVMFCMYVCTVESVYRGERGREVRGKGSRHESGNSSWRI